MFNMLNLYNLRSFVYKMDIWQEVFGKIKASVVVGSIPDVDEMNKIFKLELNFMESGLGNMSNSDILGISEIASKKEIHEAFRRLALLHHADRGGNEEEFKKIKQSYDDIKQGKKYPDNNAEKKHKSHVYSTDDEEETRRRNAILAKEISEQMKLAKEWSDALSRANITGRHLFGSKVLGEMEFERTANGVMSIKGNIMAGIFEYDGPVTIHVRQCGNKINTYF